jgi:hypothetical protein
MKDLKTEIQEEREKQRDSMREHDTKLIKSESKAAVLLE